MTTPLRPLCLSSLSLLARGSLVALAPCLSALLGCASESVDLGGSSVTQQLQTGSRCAESPIISEDVLVEDQADLAALEGCQEIDGDLAIQLFADADLSPLHELRVVEGTFTIGQDAALTAFSAPEYDEELVEELSARDAELVANGWLASLAGLESLERAGALQLQATSVTELSALSQLRVIGGRATGGNLLGSMPAGYVGLYNNRNLIDLSGLENVGGVDDLALINNSALVSLAGFTVEEEVTSVSLSGSPELVDLDALSPLQRVIALSLGGLGISDLSAFSTLESAELLSIEGNAELADASALSNLASVGSLYFVNNASLRALPSFALWFRVPEEVVILDNPVLESIDLEFGGLANSRLVDEVLRPIPTTVVDIENNPALRSLSIPPAGTDTGLTSVEFFLLRNNPSLTDVDFGGLRRAGLLSVAGNQTLETITLGALARVEDLEVTDNPLLSGAVFDEVATFERTLSGNLP